jgi:hypothetical protein
MSAIEYELSSLTGKMGKFAAMYFMSGAFVFAAWFV